VAETLKIKYEKTELTKSELMHLLLKLLVHGQQKSRTFAEVELRKLVEKK